ncbi:MAG: beta-xylosidase [Actinomycetota bacterium]|nr:beta-xylosidase [Actinomycetota bacterium]
MTTADSTSLPHAGETWRDPGRSVSDRVEDLLSRMTLTEKIAQLYGVWVGADAEGSGVAPHQHELADEPVDWPALIPHGLGQLTRPFGSTPVDPALGARALARTQAELMAANRFGIPAMAHEECLAGFTAWGATIYPVPLAWGAGFDPELVKRMAQRIGRSMRQVGIHQGLAPVLDVVRDPRWGRVEETIGEDPYLVATVGSDYVKGLESTGVVATLKHFVGYSASRAARNHAPSPVGPREVADVLLPPFEMALREGGARSVMHSYAEIDGIPPASDTQLLTGLLRDTWGFTGTVVADYFGVAFLELQQKVAADAGHAAGLALAAGVDVELPTLRCFGSPLQELVESGEVDEALVDRALRRVLHQKCELGLLDPDWSPVPPALLAQDTGQDEESPSVDRICETVSGSVSLDTPEDRDLARTMAEQSLVLLVNSGLLPLDAVDSVAVVGPNADDPMAMMGCYSFPNHVGRQHPRTPMGVEVPTVLQALTTALPGTTVRHATGCTVDGDDRSGIEQAASLAADSEVCIAVLGDRAGLFGRGTSGEGCDAPDLALPGLQADLVRALLDTGKPVVLVLLTGRPYALGDLADRSAGVLQAFFPGEEGGTAIANVLTGRVNPSGRLPVGVPRRPGGQPYTYLAPPLGQHTEVSSIDPTPHFPFGFGLSYTQFAYGEALLRSSDPQDSVEEQDGQLRVPTDGSVTVSCTVTNTGDVDGAEVVQLYLHDPVAQVTRPVIRLVGYRRVSLPAGRSAKVTFEVPVELSAFTGRDGRRVVEPGELELRLGSSSAQFHATCPFTVTGPLRPVGYDRALSSQATHTLLPKD